MCDVCGLHVYVYIYVKKDKTQKIHNTRLWRFREMIEEDEAVKIKSVFNI